MISTNKIPSVAGRPSCRLLIMGIIFITHSYITLCLFAAMSRKLDIAQLMQATYHGGMFRMK